ncbi:hypothetical protein A3H85_00220 [Candidatus Daviesbacteria bacterium RIFCSPLOWO2_02_FULL_40_8]|uniref:Uncharacterized protein n=1 Tax=Candidatus Daviesbacteria bacterium RIFCSPLOWO2_01_FULL_40_24 TaxID=1797787 RepID=A0A1F5MJQ5_9BACT|nr:MAG: hypothetical protein A2780_01260 [Candidatus Daviesbacteria bacterium RIFCSPHIGHO2_01_FULL_41_45]OGE35510.1 MAG: hypothetical protein A3C32_03620 [Candidatus Daviesbacteria bacterium RIFCSPHIGHO2_02_FULL_41_14]OGE65601.1 MAG: hypothetical protein A3B49_02195 [Candidatus Daviesbacteria bacterium RIFCSPLOWO2_01_FULL_40_24]OGE66532.1 MAG: hypothetical protein A3H85_00220 [Candidatus Daviesbacteria bacterium RIFCSPLOWO2_02_FULL_40_8]
MKSTSQLSTSRVFKYDLNSLLLEIARKKNNIKIFGDAINLEKKRNDHEKYILTQIDKNHYDVKIIKNNIKKRKLNIQTFREATLKEKREIKNYKQMIELIKTN